MIFIDNSRVSSSDTKLSFIVKLYHIKRLCRISDKAMTMRIKLLGDVFEAT